MTLFKRVFISLAALCVATLSIQSHAEKTVTYFHTDALGSVVAASNEDAEIIFRKTYDPFGNEILERPDGQEAEQQSYTGKPFDAETGLVYLGQRYYDPQVRRFMGIDPVGFVASNPTSFNRYNYANNNPYRFVDPDGRRPVGFEFGGSGCITLIFCIGADSAIFIDTETLDIAFSTSTERGGVLIRQDVV